MEWNDLPVDVIGLDWRLEIRDARAMGITKTLQGNLDPAVLLAPWEVIEERVSDILTQGITQPGYIFNLGHGIFPDIKPETIKRLTQFIHEFKQ